MKPSDHDEIERLQKDGHTYHCACRIVWGDGECECRKKGIIPGRISKSMVAEGSRAQRSRVLTRVQGISPRGVNG